MSTSPRKRKESQNSDYSEHLRCYYQMLEEIQALELFIEPRPNLVKQFFEELKILEPCHAKVSHAA